MFNIGDKVQVDPNLNAGDDYDVFCAEPMEEYAGKYYTILGQDNKNYKIDASEWVFSEDMLHLVEKKHEFTSGDIVSCDDNGTTRKGKIIGYFGDEVVYLVQFNESNLRFHDGMGIVGTKSRLSTENIVLECPPRTGYYVSAENLKFIGDNSPCLFVFRNGKRAILHNETYISSDGEKRPCSEYNGIENSIDHEYDIVEQYSNITGSVMNNPFSLYGKEICNES